jgi:hypothetical protein
LTVAVLQEPAQDRLQRRMRFPVSDQRWINESILQLDGVITRAAHKAGVIPVNTYDAFDRHELCTDQPWMNGLILGCQQELSPAKLPPQRAGLLL